MVNLRRRVADATSKANRPVFNIQKLKYEHKYKGVDGMMADY